MLCKVKEFVCMLNMNECSLNQFCCYWGMLFHEQADVSKLLFWVFHLRGVEFHYHGTGRKEKNLLAILE